MYKLLKSLFAENLDITGWNDNQWRWKTSQWHWKASQWHWKTSQ